MPETSVFPDAPRYTWTELANPASSELLGVDEFGIEEIAGKIKLLKEPALDGAPLKRGDSILLSSPGLAETYTLVAGAAEMKSDERRRAIDRVMNLISTQAKMRESFFDNLDILSDPENVANQAVPREAQRLKAQVIEKIHEKGLDIFQDKADKELIQKESVQKIIERFVRYRNLRPEKRKAHIRRDAREFLKDPDDIEHYFETVDLLVEAGVLSDQGAESLNEYRGDLVRAINHVAINESAPNPTDTGLEHWLELWANKDEKYGVLASHLLGKMINSVDTQKDVTDLMYRIALAGYSSGDKVSMAKVTELLTWSTDLMPWHSKQGWSLEASRLNEDEETRLKALELNDVAISYCLSAMSLEDLKRMQDNLRKIANHPPFLDELNKMRENHPKEFEEAAKKLVITENYKLGDKRQRMAVARSNFSKFFKGTVLNTTTSYGLAVGPLGEWLRDNYAAFSTDKRAVLATRKRRTVLANLNLPGHPVLEPKKMSAVEASNYVRDKLQAIKQDTPIEARTFWNTLGYLTPEGIGSKQWAALLVENRLLTRDMITDKIHSLSPRGDHLEIVNEDLKKLGFDSIDFAMHPARKDYTVATLRVGNAAFKCYLDRNYVFREMESGHNLSLKTSSPFLEFVVLSHLHQIHCTGPGEREENEDEVDETGRVEYRRAHRRILPETHRPSGEQIIKAWDEYGIDLVRQNRFRLDKGETQLITWVSQVRAQDIAGRAPVYSKGDIAGERLFELLI